jgi:hypothetical protein
VCCECCVLSGRGLSVVSVVCCQVEVSARDRSVFERSPTECCVLAGRGLCDELIPLPEESFRMWRVCVRSGGLSVQLDCSTTRKNYQLVLRYWVYVSRCNCPNQSLNGRQTEN